MIIKIIRRYLLAGILITLPTFLTISLIYSMFKYIDNILKPLFDTYLGYAVPGLGFVVVFLVILLAGMIASNVIGRQLIHFWEAMLKRIPVISKLFTVIREISHSFLGAEKMLFSQVVIFEYPYHGLYSIGFVTKRVEDNILSSYTNCPVVNIFLPTTPNPTSGLIIIVPVSKIIILPIGIEEAMKFIMSAGSILPPSLYQENPVQTAKALESLVKQNEPEQS